MQDLGPYPYQLILGTNIGFIALEVDFMCIDQRRSRYVFKLTF